MFNQRDIENYFSELISILGYKPTKQGTEARLQQVDFNYAYRHDDDLGTRVRTVREKKYTREQLVLARGHRNARSQDLAAAPTSAPTSSTRFVPLSRWNSGRAFYPMTGAQEDYLDAMQERAARDGRAHHADKAIRLEYRPGK